jgi:polyisoprenyl-phosphate glycosyltransferase
VLNQMREKHRFLRGMSVWVGFRQVGVPYRRAARFAGETKYPFKKMFRLAKCHHRVFVLPPAGATYLGFMAAGISILAIPWSSPLRIWGSDEPCSVRRLP